MNKHFLTGVALFVLGGLLAGCTHDDVDYSSIVDGKVKAYQEVFVDAYGKIDPNQTWGFTTPATTETTRASYPDANMWGTSGVPNSTQPYVVPQPLSDAQKDKVRRWFQQHKNPEGTALHYTDFFVQQVYKGHTNLEGANEDCLEEYTAGNGTTVIGSEQTDYLMAGKLTYDGYEYYDHIFDFNNANYSGGYPNQDVWDGTLDPSQGDDFNDQKVYHQDQIMLLMNSSTESFGFHSSQGSCDHHDRYVIIPGDMIQAWDNSTADNADVSGMWFVGFDYDALMENVTNTNMFCIQPDSEDDPNAVEIANRDGLKAVIGGADGYYSDWIVRITPGVLKSDITIPIDQGTQSDERITVVTTKEHYENTQLIEQGRVFCEDLGQISSNDLDFNDVVFDAYVYKVTPSTRTIVTEDGVTVSDETVYGTETYKTTIVLLAAGGTLQLSLAGVEVHNKLGGNPVTTIINTAENTEGAYRNTWDTQDPVVLGTNFTYSSIVSIPIVVKYNNGETLELKAEQGWAPHKILVPIGTKWCKERVDIATAYTDFLKYVDQSKNFWEESIDDTKLYNHPKDIYRPVTNVVQIVRTGIEGPTTTYRNKGTTSTSGGYQGEEILSRRTR